MNEGLRNFENRRYPYKKLYIRFSSKHKQWWAPVVSQYLSSSNVLSIADVKHFQIMIC